jgi:hypothetical protein
MPIVGIRAFASTVRISNRSKGTDKPRVCRACHLSDPQPKHLVACVLQVTAQCRLRPGAAAAQCRLPYGSRGSPRVRSGSDVRPVPRERGRRPHCRAVTPACRHLLGGGVVSDSVFGLCAGYPLSRLPVPFIPIMHILSVPISRSVGAVFLPFSV